MAHGDCCCLSLWVANLADKQMHFVFLSFQGQHTTKLVIQQYEKLVDSFATHWIIEIDVAVNRFLFFRLDLRFNSQAASITNPKCKSYRRDARSHQWNPCAKKMFQHASTTKHIQRIQKVKVWFGFLSRFYPIVLKDISERIEAASGFYHDIHWPPMSWVRNETNISRWESPRGPGDSICIRNPIVEGDICLMLGVALLMTNRLKRCWAAVGNVATSPLSRHTLLDLGRLKTRI